MPAKIKLPPGFSTRPKASKLFNRSERQLERDLVDALFLKDAEVLSHWVLVTKDDVVREGINVERGDAQKLTDEGMVPTWGVEGMYLEEKYGRKGQPKPTPSIEPPPDTSAAPENDVASESDENPSPTPEPTQQQRVPVEDAPLPDDMRYLKYRVLTLEAEQRSEKVRHEKEMERERQRSDTVRDKLFDELDVKNDQIEAWDTVMQDIIERIAKGEITTKGQIEQEVEKQQALKAGDKNVIEAELVETAKDEQEKSGSEGEQEVPTNEGVEDEAKPKKDKVVASTKKPRQKRVLKGAARKRSDTVSKKRKAPTTKRSTEKKQQTKKRAPTTKQAKSPGKKKSWIARLLSS